MPTAAADPVGRIAAYLLAIPQSSPLAVLDVCRSAVGGWLSRRARLRQRHEADYSPLTPMSIRFRRALRRVLPMSAAALVTAAGLAAAQPRLTLEPHDRVMLVGNTLAERQMLFNHFETSLLARFPALELTVRNLGWSGDTPSLQPRPLNFGDAAQHLTAQKADVVLGFFGLNESFGGEAGLAAFEKELEAWVA